MANTSTNQGTPEQIQAADLKANNGNLRTALFSYIIDCWIVFTQVNN